MHRATSRSWSLSRALTFVLAGALSGCGAQGGPEGDGSWATSQAITQSSPTWAKLAVIQSGSPQPPADMLARFERAFNRLEVHCPDLPNRIGDFIVAGQRQLI